MTDQHRATPEQWAKCEEDARLWSGAFNCILELRARVEALEADQLDQAESHRFCTDAIVRRVEALEAAQQDKLDRLIALDAADPTPDPAMAELRAASAEAQPGGLVERVANAMGPQSQAAMDAGELPYGAARAAIREVAKWLRENDCGYNVIRWLEQEVDR
jgi:hypothetical protein